MTTKTLIITPQGTAREINPIGEKPNQYNYEKGFITPLSETSDYIEWKLMEDSLKEYKIINARSLSNEGKYYFYKVSEFIETPFYIGNTYQCKVNEEDKTAIIL